MCSLPSSGTVNHRIRNAYATEIGGASAVEVNYDSAGNNMRAWMDALSANRILQEFVQDGRLSYWTTLSDLEVVAGGRAA